MRSRFASNRDPSEKVDMQAQPTAYIQSRVGSRLDAILQSSRTPELASAIAMFGSHLPIVHNRAMDHLHNNFANVPASSIDAFVAQAETMLADMIKLAIAQDSKATALAGGFGAAALALFGAAATMRSAGNAESFDQLALGCTATAALMLAACLCFAWAARSVDFNGAGFEPALLEPVAQDRTWMLRYVAASLQRRIDDNRTAMETTAWWTNCGMYAALISVPTGLAAYCIA